MAAETVREPMFLLLLAAGMLHLLFGDLQEGLTLFGLVLVTLGLKLFQEGQTGQAIEALRDPTSPRARRREPGADDVLEPLRYQLAVGHAAHAEPDAVGGSPGSRPRCSPR